MCGTLFVRPNCLHQQLEADLWSPCVVGWGFNVHIALYTIYSKENKSLSLLWLGSHIRFLLVIIGYSEPFLNLCLCSICGISSALSSTWNPTVIVLISKSVKWRQGAFKIMSMMIQLAENTEECGHLDAVTVLGWIRNYKTYLYLLNLSLLRILITNKA